MKIKSGRLHRGAAFSHLILGALLLAATARSLYATRAALVGGGGTRVGEILSLAEAKLAGSRAVQLVERREVDRVLAEQKVSLGGFATGEQAITLVCDLFHM